MKRSSPVQCALLTLSAALGACDADVGLAPEVLPTPAALEWDSPAELREADRFQIRGESKLGCHGHGLGQARWDLVHACAEVAPEESIDPLTNLDRFVVLHRDTTGFVPIPRAVTKFAVEDAEEPLVAVTFSTLARVSEQSPGAIAKLRVLIDGQQVADPGPVTFWSSRPEPARWAPTSFTFLLESSPGVHTVEVQYESQGATIALRDLSLRVDVERWTESIVLGFPPEREGLFGETSAPNVALPLSRLWQAVPGGGLDFATGVDDDVLLVWSPTLSSTGGAFAIRAVVDGVPVYPGQIAFDGDQELAARSVAFAVSGLPPGNHHVTWQWFAPGGVATVTVERLTELAVVGPQADPDHVLRAAQQALPMVLIEDDNFETDDEGWTYPIDPYRPVPGLETWVDLEEISDAAITVTGHYSGNRAVFVAPTVDGEVLRDQKVLFGADIDRNAGARTYTFAVKDLAPGPGTLLGVAVRSAGDLAGQSMLGSATAAFQVKRRVGPDLAVGPRSGAFSREYEAIIEPVVGPRKVLAIAFDTGRDDAVVVDKLALESLLDQSLSGPVPSAATFLTSMSGGLASLQQVAPTKLYAGKPEYAGGDEETNYYWDPGQHDCTGSTPLFRTANQGRWASALLAADAAIDFASFDADRDRVLEAHELAVIVYQMDDSPDGSTAVHNFRPYCGKQKMILDGVWIRELAQIGIPAYGDVSDDAKREVTAVTMHELGHLLLGLDDIYYKFTGKFDASTGEINEDCGDACEDRVMNTDPYRLGLMSKHNALPHLTGVEKLHLGWVNVRLPRTGGPINLVDVTESREVVVLPRRNTDAKEYFLLETRAATDVVTAKYDYYLGARGLAAYHVVDPTDACFEGALDQCKPLLPPPCVDPSLWRTYADNFVRAGLRLLQKDLTHVAGESDVALFNLSFNLTDEAPGGGPSCPTPSQIGEKGGLSYLMWVDDTPSGYQALDIDWIPPLSNFDLVVP